MTVRNTKALTISDATKSRFLKTLYIILLAVTLAACGGGGGEPSNTTQNTGTNTSSGSNDGGANVTLTVSNTTPTNYQWTSFSTNDTVYIDRNWSYTSIPSEYMDYKVLKTANDDKHASGSAFLTFEISLATTVYVGHDVRISTKPAWLSTWQDTGTSIVTPDASFNIYKKYFPAGIVTIGGNMDAVADGSMYIVFINGTATTSTSGAGGGMSTGVTLTVSWDPSSDTVNGYAVYVGATLSTATQLVAEIPVTKAGFNPTVPSASYDSVVDLKKTTGEQVCFRVKAYNITGYSNYSNAACTTI